MMNNETAPAYFSYDLPGNGIQLGAWIGMSINAVKERGHKTPLGNGSEVLTLKGRELTLLVPFLGAFYRTIGVGLANRFFGQERQLACSQADNTSVFLNGLLPGQAYEAHVDTNPVTGLLFITSHEQGGELCLKPPGSNDVISIAPQAGQFVIFKGGDIEHWVNPADEIRVSAPMNFYFEGDIALEWDKI